MSYLSKFAMLVGTLVLGITLVLGKTPVVEPPQTFIRNFLFALYQTSQDPLAIAKQYIALDGAPNEYSTDVRYKAVADHLALLRQGKAVGQSAAESNKPILFTPTLHKIIPYAELDASAKLNISLTKEQEANIYVLVENEKPLRYFFMQNKKISSFDYMVKGQGGPAYFISY